MYDLDFPVAPLQVAKQDGQWVVMCLPCLKFTKSAGWQAALERGLGHLSLKHPRADLDNDNGVNE